MKKFIVFICFAIGLMVSLPSTSSGSESPPGQVSFVADHFVDVTAMVVANEVEFKVQLYKLICEAFTDLLKGGGVVIQELNLDQRHLYLNSKITIESTALKNYNPDIRLCRHMKLIESQIKNIESRTRCTIRADSQV